MTGRLTNLDALKQAIYDSVNIVTIAERLGMELQASGEQWRGLCPLHVENTPSWYANPNKGPGGVYHCYGCQQGGDLIDLVEKVRHLNFIEALYWLANEADVDISAYERPLSEEEKRQEELRSWAEGWLGGGAVVNDALAQRVPIDTLKEFGIHERTGISTAPSYFTQENSYLGDGVILPWRTPSGRLVGWRRREHPGQEKDLKSTPNDFPLGKVREQTLFGIQVARQHITEGRLYLVEGEYDCLALHAHGIKNAVALGGNGLTDNQMQLLQSLHIREIVVVLDGDEGGHKGAHALANKYWAHDVFVRVTTCNEGTDPEDVVREGGAFFFELVVSSARSALEWLLRQEWARKGRETLTDKMEFVKWVRDTYGQKLRSTDESLVLVEVARWLGIPEVEVRDYVRAADGSLCAVDSERMLLGRCLRDQHYYVHLRGRLVRDDFFVLKHQRVWDMMADMLIDGLDFDRITAEERAGRHGVPEGYVGGLIESPESNLDHHIGVVADLSLRRSARDDAMVFRDRIQDLGRPADNLVGDLTHRLITKALSKSGTTSKQLSDHVDKAMEELQERMNNPSEIHGLDLGTQQPRLSRVLQGLQGGRLYLVSAISRIGKALDCDTPLPTPTGWITMGEVQEGDWLFDERGQPTRVTAVTEVMIDRPCYEIKFSDRTTIVADADHQWLVKDRSNPGAGEVIKTTSQMAKRVVYDPNEGAKTFAIRNPGPLDCPNQPLPLDPYLLGAWLGDGTSAACRLHTNRDEAPFFIEQIERLGYTANIADPGTGGTTKSIEARTIHFHGAYGALKAAGVWGDKHIPVKYLRASIEQRTALLQGLMDTDGTVLRNGNAEFITKLPALRDGVMELLRSLGLKPTVSEKYVVPSLRSNVRKFGTRSRYGPYYRIHFRPSTNLMPVRMPHKCKRVKPSLGTSAATTRRIVAIKSVPTRPVRCLQVNSPSSLYLAGNAMVPTHNTTLLAQWAASIGVHQSIPIDFISLEMDESELLYKMASHMTGIDSTFITGGRLDPAQARLVEQAMLRIRNSPLHIWAPDGLTSSEFLLYARESVMQRRTQAFFVDYIQLIDPETGQERDNGYKLYGDFARLAKMKVARSLDVAVVAAAQLGRQAADTDRPTAEMMGDSYAMVRHSNVVLILHGKEDQPTLDLYVDKNRGGAGGGTIPYIYDRPAQTMREAEGGLAKPEYTIA